MSPIQAAGSLIEASRHAAALIHPNAARRDLERILPREEIDIVRRMGLQAARVPAAYGGPDAGFRDLVQVMLNLSAADPSVAQSLQSHFFFLELMRLEGTPEQRARAFGLVRDGAVFANAIAERGKKSPSTYDTRLAPIDGGWQLDGIKHYCTGSLVADWMFVLALNAEGGQMVAMVPVDRAGLVVVDDWDGMGQRTTGSGMVRFDGVHLDPEDALILRHWGQRRSYLNAAAQLVHATIDAGIARGALDDAVELLRRFARPGGPGEGPMVSQDPYALLEAGHLEIEARTAEAMLNQAADALDLAAALPPEASDYEQACSDASIAVAAAKAVSTAAALKVSEGIFKLFGAAATGRSLNLDRHWRNARTHTTHDPIDMKYRAIGNFLINGIMPDIAGKI